MKLKRITLATLATLAAPAAALAQSNVQIYGTLNADFESVKATGSSGTNFPSRNRVTSNSSNFGFRGTEDLGQGLRAFFQLESAVNFDNGTSSGFWPVIAMIAWCSSTMLRTCGPPISQVCSAKRSGSSAAVAIALARSRT